MTVNKNNITAMGAITDIRKRRTRRISSKTKMKVRMTSFNQSPITMLSIQIQLYSFLTSTLQWRIKMTPTLTSQRKSSCRLLCCRIQWISNTRSQTLISTLCLISKTETSFLSNFLYPILKMIPYLSSLTPSEQFQVTYHYLLSFKPQGW